MREAADAVASGGVVVGFWRIRRVVYNAAYYNPISGPFLLANPSDGGATYTDPLIGTSPLYPEAKNFSYSFSQDITLNGTSAGYPFYNYVASCSLSPQQSRDGVNWANTIPNDTGEVSYGYAALYFAGKLVATDFQTESRVGFGVQVGGSLFVNNPSLYNPPFQSYDLDTGIYTIGAGVSFNASVLLKATQPLNISVNYSFVGGSESDLDVLTPTDGSSLTFGTLYQITATPKAGITVESISISGGVLGVAENSFYAGLTDVSVTITLSTITAKISGSITFTDVPCPAGHVESNPIVPGGQAWDGTKWNALETSGTLNVESEVIDAGEPTSIAVYVNDLRSYISSFTVNGADMLANQSSGLPDDFHPNVPSGSLLVDDFIFFDMPAANVNFSVTIRSDRLCMPGRPILPSPVNEDGGPPDPFDRLPPGTPPRWDDPPTTPGIGGGDSAEERNPPPGYLDGSNSAGTGAGGGGGGRTGAGAGVGGGTDFPSILRAIPPGTDWDLTSKPKGLLIRWRNNRGQWGKWHVVDLGQPGDTKIWRELRAMGEYQTRQYEIVHVDRVPSGVFDIEEFISSTTDTPARKKG